MWGIKCLFSLFALCILLCWFLFSKRRSSSITLPSFGFVKMFPKCVPTTTLTKNASYKHIAIDLLHASAHTSTLLKMCAFNFSFLSLNSTQTLFLASQWDCCRFSHIFFCVLVHLCHSNASPTKTTSNETLVYFL